MTDQASDFKAHFGKLEEVGAERDAAFLEEEDQGGSAEGKIAFFCAFLDECIGGVGLGNGADVGGTDFQVCDVAKGSVVEIGDGTAVLQENLWIVFGSNRMYRKEFAVNERCLRWRARDGEVEAMAIGRAKTGKKS